MKKSKVMRCTRNIYRSTGVPSKKLIDHDGCAIAVGTTSVRTLESLYHIGVTLAENPYATEEELRVKQWQPYEKYDQIPPVVAPKRY